MKITPAKLDYTKEYDAYSYLGAIDNLNNEAFGIPTVYYFDMWSGCLVLATKLLESNLITKFKTNPIKPLDILIVFREFVS